MTWFKQWVLKVKYYFSPEYQIDKMVNRLRRIAYRIRDTFSCKDFVEVYGDNYLIGKRRITRLVAFIYKEASDLKNYNLEKAKERFKEIIQEVREQYEFAIKPYDNPLGFINEDTMDVMVNKGIDKFINTYYKEIKSLVKKATNETTKSYLKDLTPNKNTLYYESDPTTAVAGYASIISFYNLNGESTPTICYSKLLNSYVLETPIRNITIDLDHKYTMLQYSISLYEEYPNNGFTISCLHDNDSFAIEHLKTDKKCIDLSLAMSKFIFQGKDSIGYSGLIALINYLHTIQKGIFNKKSPAIKWYSGLITFLMDAYINWVKTEWENGTGKPKILAEVTKPSDEVLDLNTHISITFSQANDILKRIKDLK